MCQRGRLQQYLIGLRIRPLPRKLLETLLRNDVKNLLNALGIRKIVERGSNLDFRTIIYTFVFEALISGVVLLISLHTYILGNGFYDYADQFWNPALNRLPPFSFTYGGSYVSTLSMGKEMITWPGILLMGLSTSPVAQDKIFTVYTFIIFLAAAWVLSEMLYRLLDDFLQLKLNSIWKELLKVFLVVAIYSNIAIMNLNVDGGTFADGFIMLLIAITIVYSLIAKSKIRALAVAASLLSLSIMLNPDYYFGFIIVLFFSFLVNYRYKIWERFALPVASVVLSLPALFYFVEGTLITATGIGSPLAARPILNAAAYSYYNPFAFILLVAHLWSTYSISPPSILLFINRNITIPFFGNIVLLPRSFITDIWILSLSLYPVLALTSLAFKATKKIAIPFVIAWTVAFVVSQWWRIPYMNDLFYHISDVPLLGPAFGTAVSLPGHYMNIMAISEAVLILILIANLWSCRHDVYSFIKKGGYIFVAATAVTFIVASWYTLLGRSLSFSFSIYDIFAAIVGVTAIVYIANILWKRRKTFSLLMTRARGGPRALKVAVTVIIVFIVLFSGWQAFDGSFFPPRSYTGNSQGILTSQDLAYSPFSPQYIPDYVVNTYNALSSSNSYYTVFYSPNFPNNNFGYQDSTLNYLILNNYSFALPAFMRTESIRYIVTYKDSSEILSALNSSGLQREYLGPSSYLYVNDNILGNLYGANLLLNYSSEDQNYILAYEFLESMNIIPVISSVGVNTLGFNALNDTIDILPSSYLLGSLSPKYYLNSTALLSSPESITLGPERNNLIRDGWYVYDNSSSTNVYISNGMFQWDVKRGIGLNVNYGNATAPGNYTMIPIENAMNVLTSAKIAFQYRTTSNFTGNLSADFGYIYYSSGKTYASNTPAVSFSPSQKWANASYSYALPQFTGWFSPSVNLNGTSGIVYLRNINVSWGSYRTSFAPSPYASKLFLGNTSIDIPRTGKFYLQIHGNGRFNNEEIKAKNGIWVSPSPGTTNVTGNLTLGGAVYVNAPGIQSLMGNYTVSDIPYSRESRLVEDGHYFRAYYTLTGQEVFMATYNKEAKMILLGSDFIVYGFIFIYIFIILFPALAIIEPVRAKIFGAVRWFKRGRSKR